jgi:hypothetical protein
VGVGDVLVPLFAMLVRSGENGMRESLREMLADASKAKQLGRDLFVMAFQTRDIRGGKGERDLFYHMFLTLGLYFPSVLCKMIPLIPEYGCWRDMWNIWNLVGTDVYGKNLEWRAQVRGAIDDVVVAQFRKDWAAFEGSGSQSLSILAKWMPRENGANDFLSIHYADVLFPDIAEVDDRRRAYRKACSAMNKHLQTVEQRMCNGSWATITPEHVPGRCMARKKRAFLNLAPRFKYIPGSVTELSDGRRRFTKGHLHERKSPTALNEIRHPANADRMACRETFVAFGGKVARGEATIKGAKVVMPHELVHDIRRGVVPDEEKAIIEGQWKAILEDMRAKGMLKGIVPLCDFSGSMSGIPMEVCMALGILISELAEGAFSNRVITFDSTPTWVSFEGMTTLAEKTRTCARAPWGTSTNFQAACSLVLDTLIENEVPPESAPKDMLVLTDMGFDAACGNGSVFKTKDGWKTHVEMIRESFSAHGDVAPRIIIWTLRDAFKPFNAKATEEGVVTLSGWSPAILEALQNGNLNVRTSLDGVRAILDVARYDAVRVAWDTCESA